MLTRPRHLIHRQTTGRAFGQAATLIRAGSGSRDENGLWNATAGQEIPLDLSQAPTSGIGGQSSGAFSDRQTDAARRSEVAIFYITGYDAEPIRTGSQRSSADRIRWRGDEWTVDAVEDYGDLIVVRTEWEDPQTFSPGYQDDPIDLAVRKLIAQASGLPGNVVIPGNGPGPAPDTVFATVLRMTDQQLGWPVEDRVDDGRGYGLESRSNRYASYSVQWYRAGAQAAGSQALEWLGTTLAADAATILDLRIHRFNQLRDMDAIVSSEWEERWGMDLEVAFFADRRWTADCVETVPIEVHI